MKRTSIFYFSLAAIATGSFISCQDYNPFDESTLQHLNAQKAFEATLNEYTKNFEDRYGKIDPNHDWGFALHKMKSSNATRVQVAEKNMWYEQYHMQVPGWPDVWYEYKEGGDPVPHVGYSGGKNHNSENDTNWYSDTRSDVPGGDVTDEEIQYVSWWFRTHRYPTSINVHWSDFYIQEISADNDRDATGFRVTEAPEYQKVNNDNSPLNGTWERNRTEVLNAMTTDQLKVKTFESGHDVGGDLSTIIDNSQIYDHIYNFNSGASNTLFGINTLSMHEEPYDWSDDTDDRMKGKTAKRMMAYYQTSGTEDWAAHYSNDQKWRNNYVDRNIWTMVHLHFVGQSGRIYDGYYIGFDYAFHKAESDKYQIRKPDGYYSNWIVKVSPGVPLPDNHDHGGYTKRIMCEDLGNTWDLDFDDVVFDATINLTADDYNSYYNQIKDLTGDALAAKKAELPAVDVTITLMAAGGTMPIWVGVDPQRLSESKKRFYEIHNLFGTTESTPVNVANGYDAPIANYHISMKSIDFDDIPIYIFNNRINEYVALPKSVIGNHDISHAQMNTSDKSKAPQKFAVPTSVLWLKETHQIEKGYGNFDAYVQNASANSTWYATNFDSSHLCGMAAETPAANTPTPGQTDDTGLVGTTSTYASILHYDVIPFVNNKSWGELKVTNGNSTISTADGNNVSMDFASGATATLIAEPKAGYEFLRWDDGQGNHGNFNYDLTVSTTEPNKATVAVDGMKYIMAYFVPEGNKKNPFRESSGQNISIYVGQKFDFGDYFNGISTAEFTSSDQNVVSRPNGTYLEGKEAGTADVTLTFGGNGEYNSGTLILHVTVQAGDPIAITQGTSLQTGVSLTITSSSGDKIFPGDNVTLTASATSDSFLEFDHWEKDGNRIEGVNQETYVMYVVQPSAAGAYVPVYVSKSAVFTLGVENSFELKKNSYSVRVLHSDLSNANVGDLITITATNGPLYVKQMGDWFTTLVKRDNGSDLLQFALTQEMKTNGIAIQSSDNGATVTLVSLTPASSEP